jgi:hypothetical protein
MNLKQLEQAVADLRAKGYHPLTEVAVQECDHSVLPIEGIVVSPNGTILLVPSWVAAVPADEGDDE